MTNESKLVRRALNIPYQRWQEIEPLIAMTDDEHTKEVLRRFIKVKQNRVNHERRNSNQVFKYT